jgi:TRAP-type uncharacterized transport system substrate-binding protein
MKTTLFALALSIATTLAAAQTTQLKVSTGSATGTYSRMFKEFSGVCKDQILLIESPSTGSIQNMDRLLGNEVNAAIVQTDVLFHRSRNEDLSNIKTLFSLHPEEVHIIARTDSQIKEGGYGLGIGAKTVQMNDITSLGGRKVAAWGGSFVTAQVIRLQTEIPFSVVEVADFKTAKAGLDAGEFAAIMMVGGQPMSDVQSLSQAYKLLMVPEAIAGRLKSVYVPAKLTYSNLSASAGIQTIATEALFVSREYKTAKYVESLGALRGCFKSSVDDLSETTGTHKKWVTVKVGNTGKWPYYELPSAKPVAAKK